MQTRCYIPIEPDPTARVPLSDAAGAAVIDFLLATSDVNVEQKAVVLLASGNLQLWHIPSKGWRAIAPASLEL